MAESNNKKEKHDASMERARSSLEHALTDLQLAAGISLRPSGDMEQSADPKELLAAAGQIRALAGAYREKYDRRHFFFSLMTDPSTLASDIRSRADRLHIDPHAKRRLLLIRMKLAGDDVLEILSQLLVRPEDGYIIPVDEEHVAVLLPDEFENEAQLRETAASFIDMLSAEAMQSARIAVGQSMSDLVELPSAFREASLTLRIGILFYSHKNLFFCGQLGIARLIYGLPRSLCTGFLQEIFQTVPDRLDEEVREMMNCFFKNSLNIAETARQMHMHRNTLVYRLEQLERQTGLEIRTFDGAMTFKIAMMLIGYVNETTDRKD